MKRHEALVPLTHDHHHALAHARRLNLATASAPADRLAAASEFIDFFRQETLAHFREEEETVFPLVVDEKEAEAPLVRLMMEHLRIHGLVRALASEVKDGGPQPDTMKALSELLGEHIRFEEKTFFPLIEDLARSDLTTLELASRDRGTSQ